MHGIGAAIHPDISAIGMPGPRMRRAAGEVRPLNVRAPILGLNAPKNLPWLASP